MYSTTFHPKKSDHLMRKHMSYRLFKATFNEILFETPLPYGDRWKLQTLENAGLRNDEGWMELLYRTRAAYQCNHRHHWESSWSMILFRFHLDVATGSGRVQMKRFGQRCKECKNDDTYHVGFCDKIQVWWIVQCLLLNILKRCYQRKPDSDIDDPYYVIPATDVPRGRFGGGSHQKYCCEACAHDLCQAKYKKLTEKK